MCVNQNTCPGCGAPWNGKRCRSCGYEPFREEPRRRTAPSPKKKTTRKKRGFPGFLVLLVLIGAMIPILRDWGQKLEIMEEANRSVTQEAVIPDAELRTLYQGNDLHIFTTEYDAAHLSDGLTLYIRNDSVRDLVLHTEDLLINSNSADQQLYGKAYAKSISKNLLRFEASSEILSVSFRLKAFDMAGSQLFTTDRITLGEDTDVEKPFF